MLLLNPTQPNPNPNLMIGNNDFRFDVALQKEFEHEENLANLLKELSKDLGGDNRRFELKHDYQTHKTGNVYIEFESRQKPSGISTSQSDWYVFLLEPILIFIPTKALKEIAHNYPVKLGGDDLTSKGYLIPIIDLIKHSQLKNNPMSYTPQPNTFTLFANDKGDNPKRPDYRGDVVLPDGTKMRLSGWVKESNGKRFISGKVEPMQTQTSGGNLAPQDGGNLAPQDGDMPF
jgi:hypothetical protein